MYVWMSIMVEGFVHSLHTFLAHAAHNVIVMEIGHWVKTD